MELSKINQTVILSGVFILAVASVFLGYSFWLFLILTGIIAFCVFKKLFKTRFSAVCLLVFLVGAVYTNLRMPIQDDLVDYNSYRVFLEGKVVTVPQINNKNKTKFEFKISNLKFKSYSKIVNAKTLVVIDDKNIKNIKIGDDLKIKGQIRTPYLAMNPNQFDYGEYLKNFNIFTITYASEIEHLNNKKSLMWRFIQAIDFARERIINIHAKFLSKEKVEVLGGVVFGNDAIPPSVEIKKDFINSGLYHLLAASGMNVGLIFGIWFFLCTIFKLPFRFSIISGGIIVLIYALMTGLPPSIVRATWMLELFLIGKLLDRQADNLAVLSLVCAIMLFYNPLMINDVGFQLSFLVTLGLLLWVKPLVDKFSFVPQWLSGWAIIPFVAQIWVAPIQAFYFNTFSVYSLLANMLVTPFIAVISFTGFIGSIFALIPKIGVTLCFWSDKINDPLLTLLLYVAKKVSSLPHAIAYINKPSVFEVILFYVLFVVLIFAFNKEFKNKMLNVLTVILVILLSISPVHRAVTKDLSLVFFNMEKGDSIVVQTPEHKTFLIDVGKSKKASFTPAKYIVFPYLKSQGINKLDGIILTGKDDFIRNKGVNDILENIKADKIYLVEPSKDFGGENVVMMKNLDKIKLTPSVEILVLKPDDKNVILFLKNKNFKTLFLGNDAVNSIETVKKNIPQNIDVLKMSSEGKHKSLNNDFLEYLNPETAVITGKANKHDFQTKKLLWLIDSPDLRVFKTETSNTVKIITDGEKHKLSVFDLDKHKWIKQ